MHQVALFKKYGIHLRGIAGQNFLVDENIQRKSVALLELKPTDHVLEIGAGLGALTDGLAASGARVFAVEKDPAFAAILRTELGHFPNLTVITDDILKTEFKKLAPPRKRFKVIGNLPYFITSPILFHLIEQRAAIDFALLMVQREVAERILAQPGCKEYGRPTLAVRFYADASLEFEVGRKCFSPVPAVNSSFIRVAFHKRQPAGVDEKLLFDVIKAAFASRRKNILNSLSQSHFSIPREKWKSLLSGLKIPEMKRAEELHLKDYLALCSAINTKTGDRS